MVIIRPIEQSPSNELFQVSSKAQGKKQYDKEIIEDNNDDLAYLHCRLLVPSSIFAVISLVAILIGSILGHFYDIKRRENGTVPSWLFASGWYTKYCMNLTLTTIPDSYLPSILRLLELSVQANVSFRIAACIPTSLRLFQSCLNAIVNTRFCPHTKQWLWYRWCNVAVPILLSLEIFFCTLFSINTIRQDYQILYKISFNLFVISALLHMIACTAVTICRRIGKIQTIDQICMIIKLLCLIAFGMITPEVIIFHNKFIDSPACHYYVPPYHAVCEYIFIISNASFHLTLIIDTRNLRFLIYPRTCSGECEPMNPENFQKGGKFEHCRSQYYISKKQLRNRDTKMKENIF